MGKFLIPHRHEGDSLTAIDSSPGPGLYLTGYDTCA
jgi:hypothetical protein